MRVRVTDKHVVGQRCEILIYNLLSHTKLPTGKVPYR